MAVKYNENDNELIKGTSKADSITNSGSDVTINAGKGNDSIDNSGYNVSINGGAGNDYIDSWGDSVTIDAGTGNDSISIYYFSDNVLIKYSGGNDYIEGFNSTDTLQIASGTVNSVVKSNGSDYFLTVGENIITLKSVTGVLPENGKIKIVNSKGKKIKHTVEPDFNFTEGDDFVTNKFGFDNVTLNALGGNDTIVNYQCMKNTIIGGAGNDSIHNDGWEISIDGGDGKDTIEHHDRDSTIHGGAGNDSIIFYGYTNESGDSINGDTGNDTIFGSQCFRETINAGKGNDIVSLGSYADKNLIEYKSGDGKDKIFGFDEADTLKISGNSYSTTKSGKNIIVTVGKGKITLVGATKQSSIHINNDIILTDKTKTTFKTDSTTKTIDASLRTKAIKITGNGLDNVIIGGSKKDSLYGKAGDDSIVGNAGNDKLYGGNGNDTLIGGKGNDSLWGDAGADTFIYSNGDGKDVIYGFDNNDTLTLDVDDFKTSYSKKTGIITLTFEEGSIKLKEFTATTFHINDDTYKISGSKFKKQ